MRRSIEPDTDPLWILSGNDDVSVKESVRLRRSTILGVSRGYSSSTLKEKKKYWLRTLLEQLQLCDGEHDACYGCPRIGQFHR